MSDDETPPAAETPSVEAPPTGESPSEGETRRGFLGWAACGLGAGLCGGIAAPLASTILTPLSGDIVSLEGARFRAGLVGDFAEVPKKVVVTSTRRDAWTRTKDEVIGAVYVRKGEAGVEAFSTVCPHASCAVSYADERAQFVCPCHNTYFAMDGALAEGPSPRGLDSLPVDIVEDEVFVTYKRFRPGIHEKEEV